MEFPKSMYRGEKDSVKAEHEVAVSEEHEASLRSEGFLPGTEFFAPIAPKKPSKKVEKVAE